MKFKVNDAIDELAGECGEPEVPFERAIRLHQLHTWIYLPTSLWADVASMLITARYLALYGERHFAMPGLGHNSANQLKKSLSDPIYRQIYNSGLKRYGGWPVLLKAPSVTVFNRRVKRRRDECAVVCDIIDYRFRYIDHGGSKNQEANISHGQFYYWKGDSVEAGKRGKDTLGGKTIRTRWSQNKRSAEFLYISERHGLPFWPGDVMQKGYLQKLEQQANDLEFIKRFLGLTAYVIEQLRGSGSEEGEDSDDIIRIPTSVKRIQPTTEPLTDAEKQRMSFYKTEHDQMRRS
jgi:hypothetical protein